MLKVRRELIAGVESATRKEDLYQYLQSAIELEHATIPPYLTAMFSLKPGTNEEIRSLIRSIVIEEMLHMTISANILVAIGGSPQINDPRFIPRYPGPLPMGIGGQDFVVGIERFSKRLVHDVFMVIEEPENPIHIETLKAAALEDFGTIGQFYQAIQRKIEELGDGIFVPGSDKLQVQEWFGYTHLFPITDVKGAVAALEVVITEGEGTSSDPFQSPGDPAHYYKFGEIYHGREIIKTKDGYAYGGDPVPFDEAGVYPMKGNAKIEDYPQGTQGAQRAGGAARLQLQQPAQRPPRLLQRPPRQHPGGDGIDVRPADRGGEPDEHRAGGRLRAHRGAELPVRQRPGGRAGAASGSGCRRRAGVSALPGAARSPSCGLLAPAEASSPFG